jgi:hypothetical protein
MPADWIILRCTSRHEPIEIAMAESTVTGFRSWLESAAPGPRPEVQRAASAGGP